MRDDVRSWRQLPLNLYQIQTKFRDELRPRAGLMRGREFIMKDGYSFHVDEADAEREYKNMYDTYSRIFTRCGLAFRAVEADTGNIGGSSSHEFQVLTETGEDALVACDSCDYAANVEQAVARQVARHAESDPAGEEGGHARQAHRLPRCPASSASRPRSWSRRSIYLADGKPIAVMVRGDREVNEIKLAKALGVDTLALAGDAAVKEVTGAAVGFAGPVGLKKPVPVYVDFEVAVLSDFVVGANEDDAHLTGVNIERDFKPAAVADYRTAAAGDACARCDAGHLKAYRGIEVGQVFFLGTKYSKPMGVTFLDADGQEKPAVMGTLRHRRHPHRRLGHRAEPRQGRHHLAGAAGAVRGRRSWRFSRTIRRSSPPPRSSTKS